MIKAVWGIDYDYRTDKCYKSPQHDKCQAPIHFIDGKYRCIGCNQEAEITPEMKSWLDVREETKEETSECFKCHNNTFVGVYRRNEVTLDWELGFGECKSCGMRLIV